MSLKPGRTVRIPLSLSIGFWVLGLDGCAYIEAQRTRAVTPDTRIVLGWQDAVSLRRSEIKDYTCEPRYMLTCQLAGSITYQCTCTPR